MKSAKIDRKALLRATASVLAPLLASPSPTSAIVQTDNYTDTISGQDWNNGSHWSTGLVPGTGYTVGITAAPASLFTVVYDDNYTSATAIYSLTIDGSATQGVELIQTLTGDNLYSGSEIIGNSGIGSYNQTAATNSVSGILTLGSGAGSMGTYNLSGGSLTAGTENIANAATGSSGNPGGSFNQSGGTNTVSTTLTVGNASGSNGAYGLSSGTLSVTQIETIGGSGNGTFSQSGGTNVAINMILGDNVGSVGNYTLSNTGAVTIGNELIGYNGDGTFVQTGGTNTANQVYVGANASSAIGYFSFSGGSLSASVDGLVVGDVGLGIFIQSGGSINAAYLGVGNLSTGYYSLGPAGTLSTGTAGEEIGAGANGTFVQSGGTHTTTGTVYLGYSVGATGVYSLSSGTFSPSQLVVGDNGNGTFNQSGGSVSASTVTLTGNTGVGVYNLSAGSLSAGSETLGVGTGIAYGITPVFSQTGGTNSISGTLTLGSGLDASSLYSLSGTGVLNVTGAEYISNAQDINVGSTFAQSGGTHTNSTEIFLGYNAHAAGLYQLSAGTLNSVVTSIGYNGYGEFDQSGGTHSVSNSMYLGQNVSGTGYYSLSGGTVTAASEACVGYSGYGEIDQSGGTASFALLIMGRQTGSTGVYSLSPTGSLSVGGSSGLIAFEVGYNGAGNFVQSGGTATTTGWLGVGMYNSGTYILSGGTLNPAYSTIVGYSFGQTAGSAVGSFVQSGGTHTTGSSLYIGYLPGSAGVYAMSGGSLSAVYQGIGYDGNGTFDQTGGTSTTSSELDIGLAPGGVGNYSLSAGTAVVNGDAVVGGVSYGAGGIGTLAISGGSFTAATLQIWNAPGNSVPLSGGILTVGSIVGPTSLFDWTGGTLDFTGAVNINPSFFLGSSITLSGTQVLSSNSTLTNSGDVTLSGGTLSATGALFNGPGEISGYGTIAGAGGFTNNGVITGTGQVLTLSNTGTNANNGNITLATGQQFQLTGGALANNATIDLNGATIEGTATLNNTSGGLLSGDGAITTPLTNSGTIALSNGTLNLPAFTSSGLIAPGGITADFTGGAIINTGYIQGFGNIANSITNDGIIQPTGNATLRLSGVVTNPAVGTITVSSGNDLILTQGLSTNPGLISLTGGTVDNGSNTLNNTGTISGYGVLRSGGLANNATITLSGGTATVDGAVTNNLPGTITVQAGTAVFNSLVTNNGTFAVGIGGNATFVNGYTGAAITNNGAIAFDANSTSGNIGGSGTLAIGQNGSPVLERITTGSGVSTMSALNIATGSQFDLTNNDLIVHDGNLQQIQSLVDAGYHGDAENGSGIITSTGDAADRTLGVLLNSTSGGQPIYTTFDGQAVTDTDVLVKYTLFGDANLDGKVDAADFVLLSNNFGKTGTTWSQGNFNDDGTTNAADFVLLSNNFGQSLGSSAVQYMDASEIASYNQIATGYGFSPSQIAVWDAKLTGVPEPGSLALVAVGAAALRRRRRFLPHH